MNKHSERVPLGLALRPTATAVTTFLDISFGPGPLDKLILIHSAHSTTIQQG
jgi:hypothetical protein